MGKTCVCRPLATESAERFRGTRFARNIHGGKTMTKKRLDRDKKWFFQRFPYSQMRMDAVFPDGGQFHGLVSVIDLVMGDYYYWEMPKAGRTPVCGKGMVWLQLIPEGAHHVITAKFLPESRTVEGICYEKAVAVWYVDVIDGWGCDPDGVAYFDDLYLDVVFDPEGDVVIDDRDELDAAYRSGELSEEQYRGAIAEGDAVVAALCSDIGKTQQWCQEILREARRRMESGEDVFQKNSERGL